MKGSPTDSEGSDSISFFSLSDKKIGKKAESRSVGFEPTTSGFGDLRSTKLN